MGIFFISILISQFLAFAICEQSVTEIEGYNDFTINEKDKIGYKLMYVALPWKDAKQSCKNEGFHLAVPRTHDQFNLIQKIVRGMNYTRVERTNYKILTWVGISKTEDNLNWKNINGDSIQESEFHTWAGGNGQTFRTNADIADPREPHCAGVDAFNHGLREYWCHRRQPYICETLILDFAVPVAGNKKKTLS